MVIINPDGKIIYRGAIDSKSHPKPVGHPEFHELREGGAGSIVIRQVR